MPRYTSESVPLPIGSRWSVKSAMSVCQLPVAIAHFLRSSFFFSSIALSRSALGRAFPSFPTALSDIREKSASTLPVRSPPRIFCNARVGSRLEIGRSYGLFGVDLSINSSISRKVTSSKLPDKTLPYNSFVSSLNFLSHSRRIALASSLVRCVAAAIASSIVLPTRSLSSATALLRFRLSLVRSFSLSMTLCISSESVTTSSPPLRIRSTRLSLSSRSSAVSALLSLRE